MRNKFIWILLTGLILAFAGCDDDSGNNTNNINNNNQQCENGVIEGDEVCDGTNLDSNDCTTIGLGFTGGTLACDGCDWDTSSCIGSATCGDGVIEGNEVCDGTNLDSNDCTTIGEGFTDGILACDGCDWDTSSCITDIPAGCGNATLDGTEVCDGENLDGATCGDFGYSGGYLFCSSSCDGYYLGSCNNYGTTCGNGIVEANEQCDGTNLNGASCWVPGTSGGTVSCTDNCTLDYSACEEDFCQLAGWYGDYYCDDCPNMGGTVDPDCADYCSETNSYCESYYQPNLGTTTCNYYEGVFDPDCGDCGDGVVEGSESCDGSDLDGLTCETSGYSAGTLACSDNCTLDYSSCSGATCGDNIAAPTETCDGTYLRGKDCTSFGFASGDLACNGTCDGYDTSACIAPSCGDGVVEGDEVCDGTALNGWTCVMLPGDNIMGDLACNGTCDDWDESGCQGFTCGAVDLGTFSGTAISETGDLCDGTGTTLYSPATASCTDYNASGSEKVFQLVVNDGDTINLTYTSDADNSLYIVEACDDLSASTCLAGADEDGGTTNTESTSYTNNTGSAQTVFIVLDHFSATCSGSAVNYTLDIN